MPSSNSVVWYSIDDHKFDDVELFCSKLDAKSLTISSKSENDWVISNLLEHIRKIGTASDGSFTDGFWLPIDLIKNHSAEMSWSNGQPIVYDNFQRCDYETIGTCIRPYIDVDNGVWHWKTCTEKAGIACIKRQSQDVVLIETENYTSLKTNSYDDMKYISIDHRLTFHEAIQACASFGGNVLSPPEQEDNLANLLEKLFSVSIDTDFKLFVENPSFANSYWLGVQEYGFGQWPHFDLYGRQLSSSLFPEMIAQRCPCNAIAFNRDLTQAFLTVSCHSKLLTVCEVPIEDTTVYTIIGGK